jgi:hypothetical protein
VKVRSFLDFLVKRLGEQPVSLGDLTTEDAGAPMSLRFNRRGQCDQETGV